jgi:hypothetical protein
MNTGTDCTSRVLVRPVAHPLSTFPVYMPLSDRAKKYFDNTSHILLSCNDVVDLHFLLRELPLDLKCTEITGAANLRKLLSDKLSPPAGWV